MSEDEFLEFKRYTQRAIMALCVAVLYLLIRSLTHGGPTHVPLAATAS